MKYLFKKLMSSLIALSIITTSIGVTSIHNPIYNPIVETYASEASAYGQITYTEIIAPQYEDAKIFSEDLSAVKKDGKWGYINKDNQVVIPYIYDYACSFNEGLAIVAEITEHQFYTSTYKLGFVDLEGNYTPFKISDEYNLEVYSNSSKGKEVEVLDSIMAMQSFHNGYYIMYGLSSTAIDGNIIFNRTGNLHMYAEGMTGQINGGYFTTSYPTSSRMIDVVTGQEYQVPQSIIMLSSPYQNCVMAYDEKTNRYGFLNESDIISNNVKTHEDDYTSNQQHNWYIAPQYANYTYEGVNSNYKFFGDNGLAIVSSLIGDNVLYGAINMQNEIVIPFQYELLYPFIEGLSAVQQNGKWGYINTSNEMVIPAQYQKTSGFGNGVAVVYDGTTTQLIDRYGNFIEGSDKIDPSSYFKTGSDGSAILNQPTETVVFEENNLKGIAEISYKPLLPTDSEVSAIAYSEVVTAIENDLVPVTLQNSYDQEMNRSEFSHLIIELIETFLDKDIADIVEEKTGKKLSTFVAEYPFNDTTSTNVVAGYALGIISGTGNNKFDPASLITKQQVATLLTRTANFLGADTISNISAVVNSEDVSQWSQDSVNYVTSNDIMFIIKGKEIFSGNSDYTREESYVTSKRLYELLTK